MLSVVYSPHPSQPANSQILDQGMKTTESLEGYQVFHQSWAVSRHLLWFIHLASEVYAKPQATILFPNQHHCTCPQIVQFMDGPNIQHFLDMGPHVIVHVGRYASIPLLERGLVCEPDFMLNQSSLTQV